MSTASDRFPAGLRLQVSGEIRESGEDQSPWHLFVGPFLAIVGVFALLALLGAAAP